MRIPIYQIDAFCDRVFAGNPAAVCPLEHGLPPEEMQAIAAENNLSETAFFVPRDGSDDVYDLRWFTPKREVDLCGHATLASAWVVFHRLRPELQRVGFETRSGPLFVTREADSLVMDFPADPPAPCDPPPGLVDALGRPPLVLQRSRLYHLAVYAAQEDVAAIAPDFPALGAIPDSEVIVTAVGEGDVDFVSRMFAPRFGIPEDPVTGSAHCTLTPYWSARLGRTTLRARQISTRGGELHCEDLGDRVRIRGRAVPYLEGEISI